MNSPLNEFLQFHQLSANDLLNMSEHDQDNFWNKYQEWRQTHESKPTNITVTITSKVLRKCL